jgi:hypothetical protein
VPQTALAGPEDHSEEARINVAGSPDVSLAVIREAGAVEAEPDPDVAACMRLLAELAVNTGVAETGFHAATDVNFADSDHWAPIKNWISRLEQNPAALTADVKPLIERAQQAIANALNGKGTVPLDMKLGGETGVRIWTGTTAGDGFLREIVTGSNGPHPAGRWTERMAAASSKAAEMTTVGNQAGVETDANSSDLKIGLSNVKNLQSVAAPSGSLSSDRRREGVTVKIEEQLRPSGLEDHPVSSTAKSIKTVASASTTIGTEGQPAPDRPIGGAEDEKGNRPVRAERPVEIRNGDSQDNPLFRWSSASDLNPALSRASEIHLYHTAGAGPAAKLFQEIQLTRDDVNRMEIDLREEPAGKLVKSEAGSGDNGLLNSSGQNAEKSCQTAAPAKDTAADQGMIRHQTLDQIVRRAAIHLRNGQQEARIDLKPDFLGHLRMQVISENHQVTVKILAEHGFVKDMIENNLHQLKADLQQQGLEVDKVEVSVSHDSEDGGKSKQKLEQSNFKQRTAGHPKEHHTADAHEEETRQIPRSADSRAIVDYFA